MDTSSLIAKAHIPQSEAILLRAGDSAELKVANLDEPVKGRVTLVSPALDPGSTTIEVWVEAPKPNPALKPGMTVSLQMTAKTVKDALAVPITSVFKNADGAYYVLLAGTDNKAHQKTVQLGVTNSELAQIAGGINAGDPVITSGGFGIPDGTSIQMAKTAVGEKGDKGDSADKPADEQEKKTPSTPNPKDKD
jgi:RND family efflux transporter MFP subunit